MTRKVVSRRSPNARGVVHGLFAIACIAGAATVPSSCQTGGIGDPCVPEDEYDGTFGGFRVSQENIESRSFQCESRICLVNHFQGRVTCPLGQQAKTACTKPGESSGCSGDELCTESATFQVDCSGCLDEDDTTSCPCADSCNAEGAFCECGSNDDCPTDYLCDTEGVKLPDGTTAPASHQCKLFVCHAPDNCQDPAADEATNTGKDCCLPGTDTPVAAGVCGQCDSDGLRDAKNSVYCSCRCGVAEGQPEDENFNFCECPDGFECAEVRPDIGLGDTQLTGKYCVKKDDPLINKDTGKIDTSAAATKCGNVVGQAGGECEGVPAAGP